MRDSEIDGERLPAQDQDVGSSTEESPMLRPQSEPVQPSADSPIESDSPSLAKEHSHPDTNQQRESGNVGEPTPQVSEQVRTGSPFRESAAAPEVTLNTDSKASGVERLDVGARQSTAAGAAFASAIILVFASVSAWSFPTGGIFVASLGCLLAVTGLASRLVKTSLICLLLHLTCFATCFIRLN